MWGEVCRDPESVQGAAIQRAAYARPVFTILALFLWIGGLAGMLAGQMLLGAMVAGLAVPASIKALNTPDDLETACGLAMMIALGGAAWQLLTAALP